MSKREHTYFGKFRKDAENIVNDRRKMSWLLSKAKTKIVENRGVLRKVREKITLSISLLKDYTAGRYRDIPRSNILLIIAGLLYLVSPVDAIFDFLPGGFIDDATVLIWVFSLIQEELDNYAVWRMQQEISIDK
ncbi:MAG TPA: YkvA family protein [Bacteroidales bacterium]|nr:YkvA family protein [Bacteroidales bacterium]